MIGSVEIEQLHFGDVSAMRAITSMYPLTMYSDSTAAVCNSDFPGCLLLV